MLLFVSYSGVLGGAERVLLDAVTRIERPLTVTVLIEIAFQKNVEVTRVASI